MELKAFPWCCGGAILVGFAEPNERNYQSFIEHSKDGFSKESYKYSEKETNEQVFDRIIKSYETADSQREDKGKSLYAMLAERQLSGWNGVWAKKLKEAGFEPIQRFDNSGGGLCTLFVRVTKGAERPLTGIPNWN